VEALGPLCALGSSVTWAFASGKYAQKAEELGGVRINFARALFAFGGWSAWLVVSGEGASLSGVEPVRALWLALSIVCSYVIGDGVFYAAAQRAGVSSALAVATVYPLWAALYGAMVRGEALGPLRLAGLAGAVLGVALLLRMSGAGVAAPADARAARVGILLALVTSLFWAGNAICLKQGAEGLPLVQANVLRFGFGAVMLWPRVLLASRPPARRVAMGSVLGALITPLVLDTLLGSACYVYGLAHSELALGATLSSLSPVAALPLGVLSGAERVTAPRAACVMLIVAAVVALVLG
jgi:drug/metabolite transporter (DMT)-like permease